jgi:hypothetical protein
MSLSKLFVEIGAAHGLRARHVASVAIGCVDVILDEASAGQISARAPHRVCRLTGLAVRRVFNEQQRALFEYGFAEHFSRAL